MAPQRTVFDHRALDSELRKPLLATSCAAYQKIRRSCNALFTENAQSATIKHNNLDTYELPALILGMRRGGFESEFLLRARRGSEADRRTGTTGPAALLPASQSIHHAARGLFVLRQAIADIGDPCTRLLALHTGGRKE
jgi:hypothetical protein